jgi:general secretion pathway protein M
MNILKQEWVKPLQAKWERLAPRERRAVGILAGVMAFVLLYFLVWSPLQRSLTRLRVDVPNEQGQLLRMRQQAAQVAQIRLKAPAPQISGNLIPNIEQSATAHGLRASFTRLEPEGANGVRIQVDGASFNALIGWLSEAQKQYALRTEQATFEAHAAPGTVNARLTLRAAGP